MPSVIAWLFKQCHHTASVKLTWVKAEVSGLLFDWHLVEQRGTRRTHALFTLVIVARIHNLLFEAVGRHGHHWFRHLPVVRGAAIPGKVVRGLWGVRCLTTAIWLREGQTGFGKLPVEPKKTKKMTLECMLSRTSKRTEITSFTSKR